MDAASENDQTDERPPWMAEVLQRRRQSETAQDVQKKWDKVIATGGDGEAPWLQEVAGKKKVAIEKAAEEAKVPQWLREVKGKNPSLMKNFHGDEAENKAETG